MLTSANLRGETWPEALVYCLAEATRWTIATLRRCGEEARGQNVAVS
jgi:hypothetical protein